MPASTLDPVNVALRTSLGRKEDNRLDAQIAGAAKKALLADVDFEPAGGYHSTVLDKLKSKYIVLKSQDSPQPSKPEGEMGADETLKLAKYELYPIEAVQLGWNKCDWSVGAGMVNMGNTCYLNSTLQALFHVPALVNWLMSDKEHLAECQDSGSHCIICAMRKTLQDSQQRNNTSIRPMQIYNKLRLVCRNLIPGRQEDAHEFLRYLVEAMEKSYLNRFKNRSEFDSKIKETTPLNQILGGYLRSAVRCLKCGHVSTTFQHFQDLLLDIRKAQTLDEALEGYFSREKLDDDSYQCQSCQKKVPATKQFSVERAPMVLCIQLKRFSVSNNKIAKHIHFRQRLDVTRYARHRPSVPLIYRLVALVTHMGPSVNCGHYTAVAQAPTGNFYQFDDSMVRVISHQTVFNTNAYIMLYELESSPFTQKSQPSPVNNIKSKISVLSPEHTNGSLPKTISNGMGYTSDKAYGPELPPARLLSDKKTNGIAVINGNGKVNSQPSSDVEGSPNDVEMNTESKVVCDDAKSETSLPTTSRAEAITKLVPYETDDSSSGSDESNQSAHEVESRVSTKAAVGEWKVTSSSDVLPERSNQGKSWERQERESNTSTNVVAELYKMSHSGYSAPVSTWNGTRAHLDKEVASERREERKRALADNQDQGRIKHVKLNNNSNNSYKSNPDYNPVQEFHNGKNNWNQNGANHKFYGPGRHRRVYHHHRNYNKNCRFRH